MKALTRDCQSGHCLHVSVVSQHVRRQSHERPEARFTLRFKTAPPLRYPLLRRLLGMSRHFLKATRWDLHRQRLKTQNRDIYSNEICCQFVVQKKGLSRHCPCAEQLSFRRTVQALADPPPTLRPTDWLQVLFHRSLQAWIAAPLVTSQTTPRSAAHDARGFAPASAPT